ncbi:MAG: hypothetical protein LBT38_10970 [Deltaproteobacteria bacterium]|jgi:type IV pilus assembly protein PilY1|nr:hypothetical protein [Deltaproteobacteria bacterium]
MSYKAIFICFIAFVVMASSLAFGATVTENRSERYKALPISSAGMTVPEVLLVVSKDLKMFYQAYAGLIIDIDGDGRLDTGFNPNATYIGYYDSDSCYGHTGPEAGSNHRSTENNRYFYRVGPTAPDDDQATINANRPTGLKGYIPSYRSKHGICRGVTHNGKKTFSGNWLNFIVSSRMDAIRKILYGGSRVVDTATETFLEPSFVPHDASIWGTEVMADNSWNRTPFNVYFDITKFTPFAKPNNGAGHYFARARDRSAYGPWDPRGTTNTTDGNIFPVIQMYANASNSPTCGGGNTGHYWDWIMQSRPVPNASAGCLNDSLVKSWRVTVKVCDPTTGSDNKVGDGEQCRAYGEGASVVYKPTGLLQEYGESGKMRFGLMTGGFNDSLRHRGGILRNHVSSFGSDSVDPNTGQYKTSSLMWAFDKLQISGRWIFAYEGSPNANILYNDLNSWGNPMGEMLFEAIRYLGGKSSPTSSFSSGEDGDRSGYANGNGSPQGKSPINKLLANNSLKNWSDRGTVSDCSKPVVLLISDIDTSFDGNDISASNDLNNYDLMPGNPTVTLPKQFSVSSYLNVISTLEGINTSKKYFVAKSNTDDCSPKTISNLNDIKGLCPMGPSYEGSYAVAAAAYYAHTHNLSLSENKMSVDIYGVTMSAAFPELKINLTDNVGNKRSVSVLPVNTTSRGSSGLYNAYGKILSFLNYFLTDMETDKNGVPFSFTIQVNFSDFGMGDDWEMDMVVEYKVVLLTTSAAPQAWRSSSNLNSLAGAQNNVSGVYRGEGANYYFVQNPSTATSLSDMVDLSQIPISGLAVFSRLWRTASGGEHGLGYTISGTTKDGTYLDLNLGGPPPSNYLTPPTCSVSNGPNNSTEKCTQSPNTSTQIRTFSFAAGGANNEVLPNPVWYAAKYGGFKDQNNNSVPDPGEWENEDGDPKNYFQATNIGELSAKLTEAFITIARSASTSTSTSASVNSVLGGGLGIQTAFYPRYVSPLNPDAAINWVGTVYALFVDKYGNFREDAPHQNGYLDENDPVVTFTGSDPEVTPNCYAGGQISRCQIDANGEIVPGYKYNIENIHKVNAVWDVGKILSQVNPDDRKIYFYNFDAQAVKEFKYNDNDTVNVLKKYMLHDDYKNLLPNSPNDKGEATKLLMRYIRGDDLTELNLGWRSRRTINPWNNSPTDIITWRLGDIINSKPIIVGPPSYNYDHLYGDKSYAKYKTDKGNRSQVVYFGSNDGFLHAIHMGVFGSLSEGKVGYKPEGVPIGEELWAYIPGSILPHLQWLADPNYNHSYYVDMKPYMADIKHNGEWRTILVCGLRLGARPIDSPTNADPKYFYSEVFALDVTNPKATPENQFLWRFSAQELGLMVGLPSVVTSNGKWYVVLPSGPATDFRTPAPDGPLTFGALSPYKGHSAQKARLFVLDAFDGTTVTDPILVPEDNSFFNDSYAPIPLKKSTTGTWNDETIYYGLTISRNSDCEDKGAVYRLQMVSEASIDPSSPSGTSLPPNQWKLKRFLNVDRPVTGAVNSTLDGRGNLWISFATGRLWGEDDIAPCLYASNPTLCEANHKHYLYGVKEELINGLLTFSDQTDNAQNLLDVSAFKVFPSGMTYDPDNNANHFLSYKNLTQLLRNDMIPGYKRRLNLSTKLNSSGPTESNEISTTQPKITSLGSGNSILAFTTFAPKNGTCGDTGTSYIYVLDPFTGLPGPYLSGLFKPIEGSTQFIPEVNKVETEIASGASAGNGPVTEATLMIVESPGGGNSITIGCNGSDGGCPPVKTPSTLATNSLISWREAFNVGFSLSKTTMSQDLNIAP